MNEGLHMFSLPLGSADDVVSHVLWDRLAWLDNKKEKPPGWVLCAILSLVSEKPFPLFKFQSSPQGLAAGCVLAAFLNLWCSFPAHLQVFSQQPKGLFSTWPQAPALALAPFPCPFILLLLPPWTWPTACSSPPPRGSPWIPWNALWHQNMPCFSPLCPVMCFSFCQHALPSIAATLLLAVIPIGLVSFCTECLRQKLSPTGSCAYGFADILSHGRWHSRADRPLPFFWISQFLT